MSMETLERRFEERPGNATVHVDVMKKKCARGRINQKNQRRTESLFELAKYLASIVVLEVFYCLLDT